tara:strand:- start:19567 stop:19893 length:327 start_codon:yes stop_codon:yes gene_type:complete
MRNKQVKAKAIERPSPLNIVIQVGLLFAMILASLIFMNVALADDPKEEPKVVYKARTEIDFEGVEIAGELVKPQGSLVMERHSAQFNPLIKLRTDFDKEMDSSVDEVK